MRSSRSLFALTFLLLLTTPLFAAKRSRNEQGPVILCYHVVSESNQGIHSISRETFVQQMRYLKDHGYRVISLAELSDLLSKQKPLPKNTVIVTVDDGWRSTLTEVFPVMQKFGFPFTAFIYPRFVGGGGSSLSWEEIRTLMKGGVDIQSHTYSHAFLTRKRQRSRSSDQYASWLWRELAGSREVIEKNIGRPVRFLAYPYGDYDSRVARAAAAAGYAAAVTCNEGPITSSADAYKLRRFAIDRTTTFDQFKSYVGQAGKGEPRVVTRKIEKVVSLAPMRPKLTRSARIAVARPAFSLAVQPTTIRTAAQTSDQPRSTEPARSGVAAALLPRRESDIEVEEPEEA